MKQSVWSQVPMGPRNWQKHSLIICARWPMSIDVHPCSTPLRQAIETSFRIFRASVQSKASKPPFFRSSTSPPVTRDISIGGFHSHTAHFKVVCSNARNLAPNGTAIRGSPWHFPCLAKEFSAGKTENADSIFQTIRNVIDMRLPFLFL